jgi:hypothetical protein
MKRSLALLCFVVLLSSRLYAEKPFSTQVKILRYPDKDQWGLIVKPGTLSIDNSASKITILSEPSYNEDQYRLEITYENIEKVNFEITTQMHGVTIGTALLSAAPFGGAIAGDAIALRSINVCWLYLGYKASSHESSILLFVPKDNCKGVVDTATTALREKVKVLDYQKGAKIDLNRLKDVNSKQIVKIDKKNHPLPEIKPDKATVIVVCPGRQSSLTKYQFKLHANDQVVAVNEIGTYSIAYLDPGKYRLASQRQDANGFDMELEAGHEYYFLQNVFQRNIVPNESVLSQNSPELVTYFLHETQFSDWKLKN